MYEITINRDKTVLNSGNFENKLRDRVLKEIRKSHIYRFLELNAPDNKGYVLRTVKNSFFYQFGVLMVRSWRNYVRNP